MDVKRKTRTGRVLSDKMDKTVVVAVDSPKRHPIYKKTIRRIKKYYVHDEKNRVKTGDTVLIEETRPSRV
jgi:small subunit ribosomal protein S17